jgi:hypothetical protein
MPAQKAEKKYEFATKTAKIGDDTYAIAFEECTERFRLTKNGIMLISSMASSDCYYRAKELGVAFEADVKK